MSAGRGPEGRFIAPLTWVLGRPASPVRDLRRRWVELTVCTETEHVLTCVLSPHQFFRFFQKSFSHLSLSRKSVFSPLFFPDIQQYRVLTPGLFFFSCSHTVPLCPVREPSRLYLRSSPRTSALAVGERETALGSPPCGHRAHTYTHTTFSAPRNHFDVPSIFPGFSLWPPEPQVPASGSPGRRGFENHRPKTDHTYKTSPFSLFLRVLCTPNIRHTYVHSLSPLAITIAPYIDHLLPCLRLFDYPFSESWCTEPWNPAPDFHEFTLFRFDELTLIR